MMISNSGNPFPSGYPASARRRRASAIRTSAGSKSDTAALGLLGEGAVGGAGGGAGGLPHPAARSKTSELRTNDELRTNPELGTPNSSLSLLDIVGVPQAVADRVETVERDRERRAREDDEPPALEGLLPLADEHAPRRFGLRDAESQ